MDNINNNRVQVEFAPPAMEEDHPMDPIALQVMEEYGLAAPPVQGQLLLAGPGGVVVFGEADEGDDSDDEDEDLEIAPVVNYVFARAVQAPSTTTNNQEAGA